MSKKVFLLFAVIASVILMSGCATKRDCNGKRLQYNKAGGFWM